MVKLKSHCSGSEFLIDNCDGDEGSIFTITDRISVIEPTPELGGSLLLPSGERDPSSGEFGADFLLNGLHILSTMLTCDMDDAEFWCKDESEARLSDTLFNGC